MRYNFPKTKKLLEEKQFKLVFEKGRKLFSKGIIIFFYDNPLGYSRLGVIIPKKSISKATQRNNFKRVVREFFRINQEKFNSKDIVVLFTPKIIELNKETLNQILTEQFNKITND